MESVFPDSHRILLSWWGLIHRSPDSSHLPSSLMLSLSMTVLRVMAVPTGFTGFSSPTASRHRAPWMHRAERCSASKFFPGDTVGPRPSPSPSHPVQRTLSWLLHAVPGSYLPWVTDLSVRVPPRALCPPLPFALHVLCCTPNTCHARETSLGSKNACVLCSCSAGYHSYWSPCPTIATVAGAYAVPC